MNIQIIDILKVSNLDYYINKYNADSSRLINPSFTIEIRNISESNSIPLTLFLKENKIEYFVHVIDNYFLNILIKSEHDKFNNILSRTTSSNEAFVQIKKVLNNSSFSASRQLVVKEKIFDLSSTNIMGIINVTPDSFSDGGKYITLESAVSRAVDMVDSGVDIIDIGGESTRPGADFIDCNIEMERVIPVIKRIIEIRPNTIISIDTAKSEVAEGAINAGASIINDISAFSFDKDIVDVAQNYKVPYCLMHIKGNPKTMQNNPHYNDPVVEIYDFLIEKINYLKEKNVNNIIVDPGIGFGKRTLDNFEIISRLSEFRGLGFPILIGVSRKSFIGNVLNLKVENRDIATIITETFAVNNGASFIRTHNTENALKLKKINNYCTNINRKQ